MPHQLKGKDFHDVTLLCKRFGIRFILLAETLGALGGCSDAVAPPPETVNPVVYVAMTARDSAGVPVMPTGASVLVWPAPLDPRFARPPKLRPFEDHRSFEGQLDSTGRDIFRLGQFRASRLDSILVTVGGPDCSHRVGASVLRAPVAVRAGATDTLWVALTSALPAPPSPALAVQVLCGRGFMNMNNGTFNFPFDFKLSIEDISDSVRGRYDVTYSASFGDDIGYFSAARSTTELVMTLRPRLVTPSCPIGLVLRVALDENGHLGVARWDESPCWSPRPFRFGIATLPFWFGQT